MFQILDVPTLLRLLDIAPEAVHDTIVAGGWTGCVWPGHPEWEDHEACVQIRSLALHYLTERHPEALPQRYETASQILASQGCPQGGIAHLDMDPLVDQAFLWMWMLAGGPTPPAAGADGGRAPTTAPAFPLPGDDPVAFTTTALGMLEALLFAGVEAAQQVAVAFLRTQPDALAYHGLELIETMTRQETARTVNAGVCCAECGTEGLDIWYTGQTWGETLCEPCYEARVLQGQAHTQEL